jgi:hypothetical protein
VGAEEIDGALLVIGSDYSAVAAAHVEDLMHLLVRGAGALGV